MQFYERCSDGTFEVAEDWLVECTICRHRYRIDRCSLHISASYLGLAPGESSSSDSIRRLGITKAGKSHLRQLLIEASGGICKGAVGHKSKALRARQNGNTAEVIAYADKANTRLRSRYYKFIRHGKKRNVAVAAIARELECFVWGMMTDNIEMKGA
jgi:transposase IS110 family